MKWEKGTHPFRHFFKEEKHGLEQLNLFQSTGIQFYWMPVIFVYVLLLKNNKHIKDITITASAIYY
ncbi:hypothetical protein CWO92_15500 [Heyndrickxia camelliae]|uniref:Uncharacterized protein n=1 Tax=Heyndrickxia camelliae TaxID=1707093 RepID=A0A2N3LHX1_9BACI|nr:hypothetical protein CWO92_15500 [Heyndrickxia camelliae]